MKPAYAFDCVMLIDDSDIDNWIAELLIRKTDFAKKILTFNSASTALNHFNRTGVNESQLPLPELIFLDITMPMHDGFNFLKQYEELNLPEIVTYILSASLLTSDREKTTHFKSVKGFILKPLTPEILSSLSGVKL